MKRKAQKAGEMLPLYDFARAVTGKYYARYKQGASVRVISTKKTTRTLVFKAAEMVDAAQVGDLLFLLRGAYAAGLDLSLTNITSGNVARAQVAIRQYLRRLDVAGVDALFTRDLGVQTLVTRQMSINSPLRLTLEGSSHGLVTAVYLAGGQMEGFADPSGAITLPSVANAIQSLRESLVPGIRAPLGYGIRSRRIQLSRDELRELMKHDPSTKHRGGFQRLLGNLQQRVDKRTGELDLFEPEMTTIVRNGRNPSKGGWQGSLHRIFGRHFDMLTSE